MIEQVKDAYIWGAIYADGSTLGEYDRIEGRGFAEVDGTQVKHLVLLDSSSSHLPSHSITIPDGTTPIFFRRRRIELDPLSDKQNRTTVHCVGWKREDQAVYLFVGDDGSTLLTDDLQAV